MPRRKSNSRLQHPGVLLALLLLVIAGLLVGTRSPKPSGLPPHFLIEANRGIEDDPASSLAWVSRAWIHFYQQQFDEGTRDLWEAIRLNPGDLGQNYSPTSDVELTAEALKHGEEQLRNMLRDRPEMAEHIKAGDEIWNWTVRKFAGEDAGSLVHWNPSDPSPFDGDSVPPYDGRPAQIRVRQVSAVTLPEEATAFDHLWAIAVFELHNVMGHEEWARIQHQALEGKLNRTEYVVAYIASEEAAVERTRAFYLEKYLPWMRAKGLLSTAPAEWHCYTFDANPESKMRRWQSLPHWSFYSDWFELSQIEGEFTRGEYQRVAEHLDALESHQGQLTSDQQSTVQYWRGHWHLVTGDPARGLAEFERAAASLQGHPSIGIALGRAQALHLSGKLDQAIQALSDWLKQHSSDIGSSYEALCYRATLSIEQGNRSQALADLAEAIRILPNRADAYGERGKILFQLKKWDEAHTDFDTAIGLAPDPAANYAGRGWVYLQLQQYDLAEADFAHALKLAPESAIALAGRASLAVERETRGSNGLSMAIADALRSCELTEWQHVDYIELLADAHRKNGNLDEASKWERKAHEVGAESAATMPTQGSETPAVSPAAKDSSSVFPQARIMLATC